MSESQQLPLFDTQDLPAKERIQETRWYYIVDAREEYMVLGYSPDGIPIWTPHDLQHDIPHVYNSARTASRDALKYRGARVKMSRFSIIGGVRVFDKMQQQ